MEISEKLGTDNGEMLTINRGISGDGNMHHVPYYIMQLFLRMALKPSGIIHYEEMRTMQS